MGTSLTGLTPATTYDALIKVGDNGPLSATAKYLSDGLGNDSPLAMSTSLVGIGTDTPAYKLDINGGFADGANNYVATFHSSTGSSGDAFVGIGAYRSDGLGNGRNAYINAIAPAGGTGHLGLQLTGGNVGIGTSTPESKLHVADGVSGGIVSIFVDNNINALNSTAQIKFTVDAGGSLTVGGAAIQAVNTDPNYANTDLVFRNSHISSGSLVEVFRLTDGARYLRMAGGTGGIQFNGDTAAANALDDYEEGTWTPVLSFGFGDTGLTYNRRFGTYTKIGRKVTLNGYIALSNKGTSTGACRIGAFPFTCSNGDSFLSAMTMWFNNISFTGQYQGLVRPNTNYSDLGNVSEAGTFGTLNDTNFATNSEIIMCITYFV